MKKLMIQIICVLLFLPAGGLISGEKKSYLEEMVINPDGVMKSQNWGEVVTSRDLYMWGRTMGLYLVPDHAPVKDNRAAVLHPDGTVITVQNLHPGKNYTLFIDPVTFRNPDNKDISSKLEVSVRCERLGTQILAELHFSEMGQKGIIALPVPYIFSHTGCVEIVLRERSDRKMTWALWDMILIAGDTLPLQIQKKKPVLEEKPIKKKNLRTAKKSEQEKKPKVVKKKPRKAAVKPVKKKEQKAVKKVIKKKNFEKKLEIRRPVQKKEQKG